MLTPLELQEIQFKKSAFGYDVKEVDRFLSKLSVSYEGLYRENIELQDKLTVLNEGIQYYKTLEKTLQDTLISAEKAASEVRNSAHKKSEVIESEAELRAKKIINNAKDQVHVLNQQIGDLHRTYENTKGEMIRLLSSQLEVLNRDVGPTLPEKDSLGIERKDNTVKLYRLDDENSL